VRHPLAGLALALAPALSARPAAAQSAAPVLPAAPAAALRVLALPVPERVGRYVRGERTDFGSPTGGVGYVFAAPEDSGRTRVNAYVYEREPERRDEPAAEALAGVAATFRQALEVERARGMVQAYQVALEAPDSVALGGGRAAVPGRRVAVAMRLRGRAFLSWFLLYAVGDGFVKVRATIPAEGFERSDVEAFAHELVRRVVAGR